MDGIQFVQNKQNQKDIRTGTREIFVFFLDISCNNNEVEFFYRKRKGRKRQKLFYFKKHLSKLDRYRRITKNYNDKRHCKLNADHY